ncbi:MAG: protein kinase, partial [Victivallales bacterium]|nr:protein kinase [Victivallales bacterium]
MRFQCPYCKTILDIDDCQPGELVACGKCGNAVNVPLSKTAPGAIIGDFVVLREIGTGGMGTVFLAHQISLDRDVALKILLPAFESDKHFLQDFINEARMAAQIRHPNVVEAYAVGKDTASGTYYFAMEFVDGLTLKQQVDASGPLSEEKVFEIATTMIDALSYGWNEKKLIHRDIKPDNIIMNSLGQAKLADLGLAKKVNEIAEDGSSELYGTPQCIAPELVFGMPATPSSDIYALGATLYFLLTGQFPYMSQDIETIVTMHLETPLPPIGDPAAPAPLETLIRIMMAKRPCHRYQNYDELKADLELVKNGQMPAHEDTPAAQVPIDSNAADPMQPIEVTGAIPSSAPAAGGGKKIAFKGSKPKVTLAGNSPSAATDAASTNGAAAVELQRLALGFIDPNSEAAPTDMAAAAKGGIPQKASSGKGKLIAIVAVIIILLGGGGAFFALKGGNKAGGGTSPMGSSSAKKVDTAQLDKLLADGSDEQAIIAEITRLLPEFPTDKPES